MPPSSPRLAILFALGTLAACARGDRTATVTIRDSAGIRLVEHPAAELSAAARWSLGAPATTISSAGGSDEGFSFIATARKLADGRIVLADNDNEGTRFLVYGPDGTFQRRVGRAGDGPGEFRNAQLIGTAGDTLIIHDIMAVRLTRITADGALIGAQDLARLGVRAVGLPSGVLADGHLLTTPIPIGDTGTHSTAHYRQQMPVLLVDGAKGTIDTISREIPGAEVYLMTTTFGGTTRAFPTPLGYGKRTVFGVTPELVHVVTNTAADVVTYRIPWAPTRIIRFEERARPVDEAARKALMDQAIANAGRITGMPEAVKASMLNDLRRAEFADSMPYFSAITPTADGGFWLREQTSAADSVPHYRILDPQGLLTARIDLPKGARLLWTDGTQALVALLNEDEVPRLELRPVTRGVGSD